MASKKNIVLIHGFLESSTMWKSCAQFLGKDYKVIIPELPGHGKRPYNGENKIDDISKLIASEIPDGSVIIGHSMGGYVAVNLSRLFPEKISSLCLFHSRAGEDETEKKENRDRAIQTVKQNKTLYVQTLINGLYNPLLKERYSAEINDQVNEAKMMETEAVVGSLTAMKNRPDHIQFLKDRHFPLFYFLGAADPILPISTVQKEMAQLPGSVAHIVQHAGHMGHYECPRQVHEFFQRIARAEYE